MKHFWPIFTPNFFFQKSSLKIFHILINGSYLRYLNFKFQLLTSTEIMQIGQYGNRTIIYMESHENFDLNYLSNYGNFFKYSVVVIRQDLLIFKGT